MNLKMAHFPHGPIDTLTLLLGFQLNWPQQHLHLQLAFFLIKKENEMTFHIIMQTSYMLW